jgi:hypothetical protein
LPRAAEEPPAALGWFHEIKPHRQGRTIRLMTRNGHNLADAFPSDKSPNVRLRERPSFGRTSLRPGCDEQPRLSLGRL